jgi:hypothetical protein
MSPAYFRVLSPGGDKVAPTNVFISVPNLLFNRVGCQWVRVTFGQSSLEGWRGRSAEGLEWHIVVVTSPYVAQWEDTPYMPSNAPAIFTSEYVADVGTGVNWVVRELCRFGNLLPLFRLLFPTVLKLL